MVECLNLPQDQFRFLSVLRQGIKAKITKKQNGISGESGEMREMLGFGQGRGWHQIWHGIRRLAPGCRAGRNLGEVSLTAGEPESVDEIGKDGSGAGFHEGQQAGGGGGSLPVDGRPSLVW